GQVEYLLTRLYNDRTSKGLLVYHGLDEAQRQAQRARYEAQDFFEAVRLWQGQHGSANGRLRRPLPLPDPLGEAPRKLAAAMGRGAQEVEGEEQRVELIAMQERCEALAAALALWLAQDDEQAVYWIDLEGGPRRVALASAPLDVGPTLRRDLF